MRSCGSTEMIAGEGIELYVLTTVPGEALHRLGLAMKNQGKTLGFERVMVIGLANGHMGYITDADEFAVGGYEALITLFGPESGAKLVDEAVKRMASVRP